MRDDFSLLDMIAGLLLVAVVAFIGFIIGRGESDRRWHNNCIERGLAEYNQTNGMWQWKDKQ